MPLTICTWNINSVRLRAGLVERLLRDEAPDVLCLQETKSPVEKIPAEVFAAHGWELVAARGDKGYNGVAIFSRVPLEPMAHREFGGKEDARHVAARHASGLEIHNFYIPAGGDEPDPEANPKFDHKLRFMDDLAEWGAGLSAPAVMVGDLNIAPFEHDVWSHKQMLKVVSHTPVETGKMAAAREAGGWTDIARVDVPLEEKLYSWWSYRARDWDAADKGRRLDHIWSRGGVPAVPGSTRVLRAARGWEKPSDHAPVFASFDV